MKNGPKLIGTLGMSFTLLLNQSCGISTSLFNGKAPENSSTLKYGTPQAVLDARRLGLTAPSIRASLASYANCEELKTDVESSLSKQWIQQKATIALQIQSSLEWDARAIAYPESAINASGSREDSAVSNDSVAPTSTASSASDTNIQERGVDEADSFRVGLDQIFAVSNGKVQVIDRASLKVQGQIAIDDSQAYTTKLYTSDHKLIVIESLFKPIDPADQEKIYGPIRAIASDSSAAEVISQAYPYAFGSPFLRVRIFATAAGSLPTLLRTEEFDGNYLDSRLIGSQLVLVANDQLKTVSQPVDWSEFSKEVWYRNPTAKTLFEQYALQKPVSITVDGSRVGGIDCTAIAQRKVDDFDVGIAKTFSLNINDAAAPKALGSLGGSEQIYVTSDSIYLLKQNLSWFQFSDFATYSWSNTADERLFIRQISLSANGEFAAAAEGELKGHIKDRWALHGAENGKKLVVTTSTGALWSNDPKDIAQNHLHVLERDDATKTLKIIAGVENFGTHEDIKSIRYVGDKVYVVTFKTIDPLFAFDLSDLAAPKLMSGLKIPGFSAYMHPLADGRMLGVGYDVKEYGGAAHMGGVQVSLFDISNPLELSRLDNHIYGDIGSRSEVTNDHHAFFYNEASKLIALPLVQYTTSRNGAYKSIFDGAQVLSFENDKLFEKGRLSHSDLQGGECPYGNAASILRIYQVDGRLVTLSTLGLKAYALDNFAKAAVTSVFDKQVTGCPNYIMD